MNESWTRYLFFSVMMQIYKSNYVMLVLRILKFCFQIYFISKQFLYKRVQLLLTWTFFSHLFYCNLVGRISFRPFWNSQIHFRYDRIFSLNVLSTFPDKKVPASCQNPAIRDESSTCVASIQHIVSDVDHDLPGDMRGQSPSNHSLGTEWC